MQRIGRVWRGSDGHGEGWLIYEKWVPTCKQKKAPNNEGEPPANKRRKTSDDDNKAPAPGNNKSRSASKPERKCNPLVQKLVIEPACCRQFLNLVYKNPQSSELLDILFYFFSYSLSFILQKLWCCLTNAATYVTRTQPHDSRITNFLPNEDS